MQNTELNGRKIDVHYSLPKEEERKAKCDRDKNQVRTAVSMIVFDRLHSLNWRITKFIYLGNTVVHIDWR